MVNSARGVVSGNGEGGAAGVRGYGCPFFARSGH